MEIHQSTVTSTEELTVTTTQETIVSEPFYLIPIVASSFDIFNLTTYAGFMLSAIGILLNALVFVALVRARKSVTSRIVFTGSLAVADIVLSLFFLLQNISDIKRSDSFKMYLDGVPVTARAPHANFHRFILDYYEKKNFLWKHAQALLNEIMEDYKFFQNLGRLSVLLSVLLLSIDLLVAVRRPMLYRSLMTRKRAFLLIGLIWGLSVIFAVFSVLFDHNLKKLNLNLEVGSLYLFHVLESFITIVVFVVLMVIYVVIYRTIISHQRRLPRQRTKKTKVFLTLVLIILTYMLFVLPFSCFALFNGMYFTSKYKVSTAFKYYYHFWVHLRFWPVLNGICDPFIYTLRMPEVKKFFMQSNLNIA